MRARVAALLTTVLLEASISMSFASCAASGEPTAAPASTASAPTVTVLPNESVESSGSALPDAQVELTVTSETDPARDWAIAVRGGTPSVDGISVPDPVEGDGWFTVAVLGLSATVEMTVALPAGAQLTMGHCFDVNDQIEHVALVAPRRLVVEVVQGGLYLCSYQSNAG